MVNCLMINGPTLTIPFTVKKIILSQHYTGCFFSLVSPNFSTKNKTAKQPIMAFLCKSLLLRGFTGTTACKSITLKVKSLSFNFALKIWISDVENLNVLGWTVSHILRQGVASCLIGNLGKKPPTLEWRQEKQEKTSNLKSGAQPSDTHRT